MMGERIGKEERLFQAHVGRERRRKAAKKEQMSRRVVARLSKAKPCAELG
jgi:hypothetical protein